MSAIQFTATQIRRHAPAIFEFLDECSVAFEWIIVAGFSGVLLLSLIYSVLPPPLHPLGVAVP